MTGMEASPMSVPRIDGWVIARRVARFVAWLAATAVVVFTVMSYGFVDTGWVAGAALVAAAIGFFVLPDLTFFVAANDPHPHGHLPRRAVPFYNLMHRVWAPAALTAATAWLVASSDSPSLLVVAGFVGGLSWIAHIAIDRAFGFGLRNADGSL